MIKLLYIINGEELIKMKGICYIIGAGDIYTKTKIKADEDDYIICADGGYAHRTLLGREPQLVVGDFDSYGVIPETQNKVVAPREKDETDMMLAVNEGLSRGYKEFVIFGALGGSRFEHSVANIQLLSYICDKGARATLVHKGKLFTAFRNGKISFSAENEGYISVFSLCDESKGVNIRNLKYEVEDFTLKANLPIGISNEFTGKESTVSVEDGTLLVIYDI